MHLSTTYRNRSFLQLVGVLLVAAFAGLFTLYYVTDVLDRYFTEHSAYLARQAINNESESLRREALAHARIAASYRLAGDTQRQIGALHYYYQRTGQQNVQIFAPDGRLVHGDPDSSTALNDAQRELLTPDRDSTDGSSVGLIRTPDGPALAAAAVIPSVEEHQAPPLLFVLAQPIDDYELLQLGFDYGLTDLHIADERAPPDSRLQLAYVDGSPLFLSWMAPTFGRELLHNLLPVILGSALVLALLVALIARDALRNAARLVASYNQLNASRSQLESSEKRFRDIAEAASDWLWETDDQLRLVYLSGRFEAITHYRISDWLGRPLSDILDCEGQALRDWLESGDTGVLRCSYTDQLGNQRIGQLASRPIMLDGLCIGYRGAASDITERVREQRQIEHLALHDPLTGLANRAQLQSYLDENLAAAQPLTLLSLDLDRFKQVNDSLGHAAGDAVLKEVSDRLRQYTRGQDLVGRLGGDEFVMIICGPISRDSLDQLSQRIIERLGQPMDYQGNEIHIGTSIGTASAPEHARDADELMRCADVALYQAKKAGRETWRHYSGG